VGSGGSGWGHGLIRSKLVPGIGVFDAMGNLEGYHAEWGKPNGGGFMPVWAPVDDVAQATHWPRGRGDAR
jgi:hypothetical protein